MNKKYIPVILMLTGGLVTVVITFVNHYSILAKLGWLLAVMAVLYFVGTIVINVIERFEAANQKKLEEEEKARLEAQEQALREEGTVEEKEEVPGETAT